MLANTLGEITGEITTLRYVNTHLETQEYTFQKIGKVTIEKFSELHSYKPFRI